MTFVKTCLLKAMLEIKILNFEKNTLKILEPKEIFLGTDYLKMGQEMGQNEVIFVSGRKSGKFAETYAAIYWICK